MDLRKLKTLIDLVSDSNVSELEITEAEGKVRIVKGGGAMVHTYSQPVYQQMQQPQASQAPVAALASRTAPRHTGRPASLRRLETGISRERKPRLVLGKSRSHGRPLRRSYSLVCNDAGLPRDQAEPMQTVRGFC